MDLFVELMIAGAIVLLASRALAAWAIGLRPRVRPSSFVFSPRAMYAGTVSKMPTSNGSGERRFWNVEIGEGFRMTRSVFVYGPQGCGKTRNAAKIAAHFGLSKTIDGYDGQGFPPFDCLILGNEPPSIGLRGPLFVHGARVLTFDEAMKEISGNV